MMSGCHVRLQYKVPISTLVTRYIVQDGSSTYSNTTNTEWLKNVKNSKDIRVLQF